MAENAQIDNATHDDTQSDADNFSNIGAEYAGQPLPGAAGNVADDVEIDDVAEDDG